MLFSVRHFLFDVVFHAHAGCARILLHQITVDPNDLLPVQTRKRKFETVFFSKFTIIETSGLCISVEQQTADQ